MEDIGRFIMEGKLIEVNVVHPTVNHPQNHHKTGAINHSQMVGLLLGLPHQSL